MCVCVCICERVVLSVLYSDVFSLAASHAAAAALKVAAVLSCVYAGLISPLHTVKYKSLTCRGDLVRCFESLLSRHPAVSLLPLSCLREADIEAV